MSECQNYPGAVNRCGYGWLTLKGKQMHASRAAWIESGRDIPNGMSVLHHCDNRRCVNLEHLYVGTQSDNTKDRAIRSRCKTQKLTKDKAEEIRTRYSSGETQATLARCYGLSSSYVSELVRGRYW